MFYAQLLNEIRVLQQVDTKTKKLEAGPWRHSNVGKAASMLVPVPEPLKGVLVLGEQTVTYIDGIVVKATPIDQVNAYSCVCYCYFEYSMNSCCCCSYVLI
jgi:hypothetical protein